jgi:hypothetical protein
VRLAKIVGRENVMGGTDCGFAQSPFARRVHPTIMWAKLKALAEGARIATRVLWGEASGSLSPPPLWARVGWGSGGNATAWTARCAPVEVCARPPDPHPSPQGGGEMINASAAIPGTDSPARPSRPGPWSRRSPRG